MQHKSYFDGGVQSLAFAHVGGEATVGVIDPGLYPFSTGAPERIEIVAGELDYKLPGADWVRVKAGQEFRLPGELKRVEFRAEAQVAYVCWFG